MPLTSPPTLAGSVRAATIGSSLGAAALSGSVTMASGVPDYVGPYEVTPSGVAQTLATAGRRMASDVTVNPIPSNYGLVTWDGSTLTVS